jgi:sulfofructose kinase
VSSERNVPRILGVGIACLDFVFVADRAQSGGQSPVRDHVVEGGGLVATALVTAARLGARAEIVTWVGDDRAGREVLDGLRVEGVDVTRARVVAGASTPVSFIHVEPGTGERTIYHRRGVGLPDDGGMGFADAPPACDVVVVDGLWPGTARAGAEAARREGIPVVGDFCPDEARQDLAKVVDGLIVPRACAEKLWPTESWEQRLRALTDLGPAFAAITAGEQGCHYVDGDEIRHCPAFEVDVVDTTGAGDVFHGAFAYAIANQWPASKSVEFASAAAALSCREPGGRRGIPTLEETLGLLRARRAEDWAS